MIQIKIIYSFDYSNYIDSNLLTETAKLNGEHEQEIKNREEVLKNDNDNEIAKANTMNFFIFLFFFAPFEYLCG